MILVIALLDEIEHRLLKTAASGALGAFAAGTAAIAAKQLVHHPVDGRRAPLQQGRGR